MVWDLQPTLNISSGVPSPETPSRDASSPPNSRPQPTAYVIAFPHPLITVNSHPRSSKEFLVSDCRGSVFLTDWRTDPTLTEQGSWRHSTLVELVEPHALKDSLLGKTSQNMGFAAWRRDNADMYVARPSKSLVCDKTLHLQRWSKLWIAFRYLGHVKTQGWQAYTHGN